MICREPSRRDSQPPSAAPWFWLTDIYLSRQQRIQLSNSRPKLSVHSRLSRPAVWIVRIHRIKQAFSAECPAPPTPEGAQDSFRVAGDPMGEQKGFKGLAQSRPAQGAGRAVVLSAHSGVSLPVSLL